jgi:hypothetical protein
VWVLFSKTKLSEFLAFHLSANNYCYYPKTLFYFFMMICRGWIYSSTGRCKRCCTAVHCSEKELLVLYKLNINNLMLIHTWLVGLSVKKLTVIGNGRIIKNKRSVVNCCLTSELSSYE